MRKILAILILFLFSVSLSGAVTDNSTIRVSVGQSCSSSFYSISDDNRDIERGSSIGFFTTIENSGNLNATYRIASKIEGPRESLYGSETVILRNYSQKKLKLEPNKNTLVLQTFKSADNATLGAYRYTAEIEASCSGFSYTERTKSKDRIEDIYSCDTNKTEFQCIRNYTLEGWEVDSSLSCDSLNSTHANCSLYQDFYNNLSLASKFNVVAGETVLEVNRTEVVDADLSLGPDPVKARKGVWNEIPVKAKNTGSEDLNGLRIDFDEINDSHWDVRPPEIFNVSEAEEKNRYIYLRPKKSVKPQTYTLPLTLSYNSTEIDLEYVEVEVKEPKFTYGLEIVSSVGQQILNTEEKRKIELELFNTGNVSLKGFNISVQGFESCGSYSIKNTPENLNVGEIKSFNLVLKSGKRSVKCSARVVVSSEGKSYGFERIPVLVLPQAGFISFSTCWSPLLLWTVLTAGFLLMRRDRGIEIKKGTALTVALMSVEGLILLYTLINCYYTSLGGFFPPI